MTDNKGRLSLGANVNLNKVLQNAQLKKKTLQSGTQTVQVEVRSGRSNPNVSNVSDNSADNKDKRLQDLLNALKKEETVTIEHQYEKTLELKSVDFQDTRDGIIDDQDEESNKFSSDYKVKSDDVESDGFKDKKSPKSKKKPILNEVKSKKDIMHLLEEMDEVSSVKDKDAPVLEVVEPIKPRIIIKSRGRSSATLVKDKILKTVKIYDSILVAKLAHEMGEQFIKVSKKLKSLGVSDNQKYSELDLATAELIVAEFGHSSVIEKKVAIADVLSERSKDLIAKASIVTIMGHVDHGKTTLLGAFHNIDLTTGEAGGITQHIGAYQVDFKGKKITFIDTPGHEAFSQIRARGAKITDIVILVVAANDSVKPQTIEAINHAQVSNVPIIVAINKCDLEDSRPDKVKQDLLQHNVIVEEMGGDVMAIEISAQKKMNLDKLMEAILLQAEIMDLKANIKDLASGVIIEVQVKTGQGIVATVLAQNGTLKVGDSFIIGDQVGKVRLIIDSNGKKIKSAIPAQPVQIIGIKSMPNVGDQLVAFQSESHAQKFLNSLRDNIAKDNSDIDVKDVDILFAGSSQVKKVNVIIKADTYGSIEGIIFAVNKISNDNVLFSFVFTGIGAVNESDVMLAQATGAVILGFNIDIQNRAKDEAYKYNVDIRKYKIIYKLIDDLVELSLGMNENSILSTSTGKCKVLKVFDFKKHKVAGCILEEGEGKISDCICVVRDDQIIHKGNIKSLRFIKENISTVSEGEFGLISKDFNSYKEDDIIYFVPKI